jgi:hypothetical protein
MDLTVIRRQFPHLHDAPDDFLRSQSYGDLAKANAAIAKSTEAATHKALDKRLATNFRELKTKRIKIAAGEDDCASLLHEARFLPGIAGPVNTLWLRAQQVLPDEGHRPLACYDLDTFGLGSQVSARGWAELHNPGSPDLSIKLFTAANLNTSDRSIRDRQLFDPSPSLTDQLPDPSNLDELKLAMATLTTANLLVKPWDHSIAVINGFLHSSRFCHQQLHGRPDYVPQLRAFIDRLLTLNAGRWRSGQSFLDAPAIGAIWQNWTLQLPPLQLPKNSPSFSGTPTSSGPPNRRFDRPGNRLFSQYPGAPRNICRRFNSPAGCPNPGSSCEVGSGPRKFSLQHLCLASIGPSIYCLQPHSLTQHPPQPGHN